MCVFVAYAMLQFLRASVMAVLQVRRHRPNPNIAYIAQCLVNPQISRIAFRRTGNVCHRLRQRNPSLRHPDKIYRLHGIRPQGLPMGSDGIRSEALAACRAQVLHLTPYHSFPSGITATAQKRAEYLRFAGEKNAILIEDDFGSEFHSARRPMQTLFEADGGEHVIYLNTFAKTVATGVRIGYMILPQKISRAQRERVSFLSCPVPTLSQFVMAQLLDSGDFERNLNRTIRAMQKEEKQNGEQ